MKNHHRVCTVARLALVTMLALQATPAFATGHGVAEGIYLVLGLALGGALIAGLIAFVVGAAVWQIALAAIVGAVLAPVLVFFIDGQLKKARKNPAAQSPPPAGAVYGDVPVS